MNVLLFSSSKAVRDSSLLFMTMGQYQATGSWSGVPDMSRNLTTWASVVTLTKSLSRP
jgi:hypothetical protein